MTAAVFLVAVVATFATHRVVRLILEDDIFEDPRESFQKWLSQGQTLIARHTGKALIFAAIAVGLALGPPWPWYPDTMSAADHLHIFEACVVAGLLGALIGCRNWLSELLSCQFCLGVWCSAGVVAVVTEVVETRFLIGAVTVLAVASAQSFLHLIEFVLVRTVMLMDVALAILDPDDDDDPAPEIPSVDDDNAATFA